MYSCAGADAELAITVPREEGAIPCSKGRISEGNESGEVIPFKGFAPGAPALHWIDIKVGQLHNKQSARSLLLASRTNLHGLAYVLNPRIAFTLGMRLQEVGTFTTSDNERVWSLRHPRGLHIYDLCDINRALHSLLLQL